MNSYTSYLPENKMNSEETNFQEYKENQAAWSCNIISEFISGNQRIYTPQ